MKILILLIVAFSVGSCVGVQSGPERDVEFVKIRQPVETVTAEPEPQPTVNVMPEVCKEALRYATKAAQLAEKMYANGDKQISIVSDARLALAGDGDLSSVENQQRALQGRTVGNLKGLSETVGPFYDAMEECEAAQ